jgi:Domain of unknown function (DUF1929)
MEGKFRSRARCLARWTIASAAVLIAPALGVAANALGATATHPSTIAPPSTAARACYAQANISHTAVRFSRATPGTGNAISLQLGAHAKPTMLTQSPPCAPSVIVGHTYSASLSYRSTTSAIALEVLSQTHSGWHVWYAARAHLAAQRGFVKLSVVLAPINAGVKRIAFGVLVHSGGTIQVKDLLLNDRSLHGKPPVTGGLPDIPIATSPVTNPPIQKPPTESDPPTTPPTESNPPSEYASTGRWTVRNEGVDHARSVHAVLLQNGKLLVMAGSGNSQMEFKAGSFVSFTYEPITETWKKLVTPKDVFCSGHVQLANGNVLILGGTGEYPPETKPGELPSTKYKGENMSWIFNIRTEVYEQVPYNQAHPSNVNEPGPLLSGTWYPSATELGNGDVISFGGLNEQGEGTTDTNYYTGPGNAGTNGDPTEEWVGFGSSKLQQTYDWFWGLYPSMILTADGRLFYDGSHVFGAGLDSIEKNPVKEPGVLSPSVQAPTGSTLYDFYCTPGKTQKQEEEEQNNTNPNAEVEGPEGTHFYKRAESTPGLIEPDSRDQSASLLLPPAQSQKVMIMGGGETYTEKKNATNSTDEIDLSKHNAGEAPHWEQGPNLPRGTMEDGSMEPEGAGKMYVSAVALPDGSVLETGGSLHPRTDNVHEASIFDPSTNSFTSVASDPVGRNYHSEALLLPDGRVMTLGSNPSNPVTGEESFETRVSIYEPPYLFKGERPVLHEIDGEENSLVGSITKTKQWEYGTEHILSYSSPSSEIKSAVLIRPAAVTHSSDPNQREVTLPITSDQNGALTVSLTENDNLAPPGYYMVFLVNAKGVPSIAKWVHVGPQGAPTP